MNDARSPQPRRQFLATASASALVVLAHRHLAWAAPLLKEQKAPAKQAAARILSLRLSTAAPLKQMKAFYHGTLGLPVLKEGPDEITIAGGGTSITFVRATPEQGKPFYHFAFNIPQNKLLQARAWHLDRSELLPVFPHLRDPDYPDDVVHFRNWNAHSLFFLDPARNVVEYIARHDLDNGADGPFTPDDILYASEIAFVVDNVPGTAAAVQKTFDLKQYRNGSEAFWAVGDEHGLLLVFRRGRNLSLGFGEPRPAGVFPTGAGIRGAKATRYAVPNFPYEIAMS